MSPLGGFDQVVAITQRHINDNLESRYKLYKGLQAFKTSLEDEEDGSMTGTMSPPTVQLIIPGEPRKARFCLHFKTGSLTFRAKLDGDTKKTMHTLPVDGWTLAFIANLAPRELQNVPDELRSVISDEICKKIENPGSYSLKQVIIDLATSDVLEFDLAHSLMPGINPANGQDIKQKKALREFMYDYLQELCNAQHNVLGYAITIDKVNLKPEDEPSLPPVSVKLQTMAYDNNSNTTPNDRDVFMFCEMIGDTTGRTQPENALEGTFAWCEPPEFGKMVISKASIWDRYFRDRLRFLNCEVLLLLNEIGVWSKSEGKQGGKPEELVPWELTKEGFPFPDGGALPAWTSTLGMTAKCQWSGKRVDRETSRGWGYSSTETWTTTSSATIEVRIDPGTNHFTLECTLSYHQEDALSSSSSKSTSTSQDHYRADVHWTLTLAFNSVETGHLGFDSPVMDIDKCQYEKKHVSQGVFQLIFGGEIRDDKMSAAVTKMVKERIGTSGFVDHVREGLVQQAGFVFPGAKLFKMTDPTFTTDGDLTVGLKYLANQR